MKVSNDTKIILRDVRRIIMVVIASVMLSANIKSFVSAGGLIPGGFSGVSILIQEIFLKYFGVLIPYSPINLLLNSVPVIICYKAIGKKFTLLSCLTIFLSSVLTDILPNYPITYDLLLISIFGGMVNGTAISMCLLAEATSGGTDFIAIYVGDKYGIDAFNYVLVANAIVIIIAGAMFGWDKALYSIIYQFTSTQVIHVLNKRYKKNTLLIITESPQEVGEIIRMCSNHGSTIFTGFGTYEKIPRTMVYSIVGSDEVKKIISAVKTVDKGAFVNVIKTDYLDGRFYTKPKD